MKRSSQGVLERGEQTEHPEAEEDSSDDDHQGPDRCVPPEDLGTVEDPEGENSTGTDSQGSGSDNTQSGGNTQSGDNTQSGGGDDQGGGGNSSITPGEGD